jgi:hypothetical protein
LPAQQTAGARKAPSASAASSKTMGNKTMGNKTWTQRSRATGTFMAQKKSKKFKGVGREA